MRRRGFTLIELLVVLAVIGVLVSLLLPAVQMVRAAARRMTCSNHLRQLALALHHYHDVHRVLPPGNLRRGNAHPLESGWGWGAMMLPHLEQQTLHARIDFGALTGVGTNRALLGTPLPVFTCPSDPVRGSVPLGDASLAAGNYVGSAGFRGARLPGVLFELSNVSFSDITDGTATTFLLGERINQSEPQPITSSWFGTLTTPDGYQPNSIPHLEVTSFIPINMSPDIPGCFSSRHPRGAQFAHCDGSVHFVVETIDPAAYQALGSRSGGD